MNGPGGVKNWFCEKVLNEVENGFCEKVQKVSKTGSVETEKVRRKNYIKFFEYLSTYF